MTEEKVKDLLLEYLEKFRDILGNQNSLFPLEGEVRLRAKIKGKRWRYMLLYLSDRLDELSILLSASTVNSVEKMLNKDNRKPASWEKPLEKKLRWAVGLIRKYKKLKKKIPPLNPEVKKTLIEDLIRIPYPVLILGIDKGGIGLPPFEGIPLKFPKALEFQRELRKKVLAGKVKVIVRRSRFRDDLTFGLLYATVRTIIKVTSLNVFPPERDDYGYGFPSEPLKRSFIILNGERDKKKSFNVFLKPMTKALPPGITIRVEVPSLEGNGIVQTVDAKKAILQTAKETWKFLGTLIHAIKSMEEPWD